jgi:epsin
VRSSFNTTPAGRPSPAPAHAPSKSSANFDDLWSLGLNTAGKSTPGASTSIGNSKSIKDLEKEKAQAGIWAASQGHKPQSSLGAFGAFNSATSGGGASSAGGGDDLLL